ETSPIITIEPTNPEVIYVPSYDPSTIYGSWSYPAYPPYSYYPAGYYAVGMTLSFGTGLWVGNALWGYCDWRGHNVNINVNQFNQFNRTNINDGNWHHDIVHRGGVPYRNRASQQRFANSQLKDAQARNAFRGRAEEGRREIAQEGPNAMQRMEHQGQQREDNFNHDNFDQGGDKHPNLAGQEQRIAPQRRPDNTQRMNSQQFHPEREMQPHAGAFDGINRGEEMRHFSDRGAASRGGFQGGGGFHGGGEFHGGGGGFHGGGGRRR
ncbi:MAG TPA: DUF3300 domain-containing protein, partial [Candidatus Berkiella sp.]|nr:DUF3300 domain-containing protein [Candidatus Berkiella sp.]